MISEDSFTFSSVDPQINFINNVVAPLDWDEYFMLQAMMAAFRSKDPSTKVGCVLVNPNNHQVGMGYNGHVAGVDENQLPWGKDPSVGLEFQKYGYVIHAEANAILHASSSLSGARCYVTLFPCNECAKLIVSKKIKEVIYLLDRPQDERTRIAKKIFDLASVHCRQQNISQELITKLNRHLTSFLL